jgi:hypothetical protein
VTFIFIQSMARDDWPLLPFEEKSIESVRKEENWPIK